MEALFHSLHFDITAGKSQVLLITLGWMCRCVSHHHEDKGDGHKDVGESHNTLVS